MYPIAGSLLKFQPVALIVLLQQDVIRLNQRWEFDSTPSDVMFTDGRHSIIGVIDVYSRRVRLEVRKTSSSQGVAGVIRRAILDWGVPEDAKTDNGKDYVSDHVRTVLDSLGINQILCQPFASWEKPHTERFFRTFSHDLVELLPGFVGHNVGERKAIESRKSFAERLFNKDHAGEVISSSMSSTDFQVFCDNWLENIYHRRVHSGLRGKNPDQVAREWREPVSRIKDVRALDMLLSKPKEVSVTKKGIRFNHGLYIAPELAGIESNRVQVRIDEGDMGLLYLFGLDGSYLTTAEDPQLKGIDRRAVAAKARKIQNETMAEARKELRKLTRKHKVNLHELALDMAAENSQTNISELPKPSHEHETAFLAGAKEAVDNTEQLKAEASPELKQAMSDFMLESKNTASPKVETSQERFRKWLQLEDRVKAGEELSEFELKWRESLEKTSEFKGNQLILKDFGRAAFGLKE